MIRSTPDGIILAVRIIPRSKKTQFAGIREDAVVVRVQAPPVEGAANAALIDFLSVSLKVPRSAIQIRSGEKSRVKQVAIAGLTAGAVRAILPPLPPPG